ncbi:MAG: DUF2924 domain-containing protein [Candidatus Omnitrophica bacterium]|nr:DUF2924 domain-containing protein [Candidatus Omnitrophota bacterium]
MALKNVSLSDMRAKYQEVCGEAGSNSKNRIYLWRKIAFRLQEREYGGLPETAQSRLHELIEKYEPVNNKTLRPETTPEEKCSRKAMSRDKRLPIPGAIIRKEYKGRMLEVRVLDKGFEFENKPYKTLSAIAKTITGAHWNGFLFFAQ